MKGFVIKSTGSCKTLVGVDIVSDIASNKSTDADIEPVSDTNVLSMDCVTESWYNLDTADEPVTDSLISICSTNLVA